MPKVYWDYSGVRMLTLEYLDGRAARRPRARDDARRDTRRELAYRVTDTWMEMIFRHGFFHGDPHPANVLVLDGGRIGLVDFGLVGKLTEEDMARLTRLFIDAATENVDVLPRRLAELGVRYPKEREEEFAIELRELYYRYYGASLADIDPIQVIREGFALIYSMNLRLPTRFVLLDKAIATLGGVGVELYPAFNVFEVARPYARELMIERFSPSRLASNGRSGAAASCTRSRASSRTRSTTCSRRCGTGRSRSASSTRGWTTSCTRWTSSPTGWSWRSSSPVACSARR